MQINCLDPYGCDGSAMGIFFGLQVALHGFENVLASAQQPDFVPLLQQNLSDGGPSWHLPTGLVGM